MSHQQEGQDGALDSETQQGGLWSEGRENLRALGRDVGKWFSESPGHLQVALAAWVRSELPTGEAFKSRLQKLITLSLNTH